MALNRRDLGFNCIEQLRRASRSDLPRLRSRTSWGACPPGCAGDVFPVPGGDGVTNILDLLFVIANWG